MATGRYRAARSGRVMSDRLGTGAVDARRSCSTAFISCTIADGLVPSALAWLTSLQDRNLNAVEIGWPFRLGLEGCIVDYSQDVGWQRTFGHGRKIVPEMLQRRGADDDSIIAFGV